MPSLTSDLQTYIWELVRLLSIVDILNQQMEYSTNWQRHKHESKFQRISVSLKTCRSVATSPSSRAKTGHKVVYLLQKISLVNAPIIKQLATYMPLINIPITSVIDVDI